MKLNIDDEQGVELLHFIFERELKPPFRKGEMDEYGDYPYYNRDGEKIGYLNFSVSYEYLTLFYDPFGYNIKDKVCQVFEFSYDAWGWGGPIMPHLKSWLEDQLNIELRVIG